MIGWLLRLSDAARHQARKRVWNSDQTVGRRGEDLVHRYLEERGFQVVARNWRPRTGHGEIDLVAWEGDVLVFVEVKSRQTDEFGAPERNIDSSKRSALFRAAAHYARRAHVEWENVRFDVVAVVFTDPPTITHTRSAFSSSRRYN